MLTDTLMVAPGDCVAVVGAGGKTTLCWRLVQELAQHGNRVVFTTTTRIRQPAPDTFDLQLVEPSIDDISSRLMQANWRTACIATSVAGTPDDALIDDSVMPVVHTKLTGFSAPEICALNASISSPQSPISILVEADGARGLLIKAPVEHEPAIPSCATVVCVVANLGALGQLLDERVAHRVEVIARLAHTQPGQTITARVLIELLSHPQGGLKNIPARARRIAVLTQRDGQCIKPDATHIATELVARGFNRVVVVAPRIEGISVIHSA